MNGAYAIKRIVAGRLRNGFEIEPEFYEQLGDYRQLMVDTLHAPVYVLPSTRAARCPAHVRIYRDEGKIPLPHRCFIIETLCSTEGSTVDLVYSPENLEGTVLRVHPHVWKDKRIGYEEDRALEADLATGIIRGMWKSQRNQEESDALVNSILDGICTIMHRGTRTVTKKVPALQRRGMAGTRTGWEYRVVEIPEGWQELTRIDRGGSHASPRWHKRRGHLRHMHGGVKVVPVRECEVGSKDLGGIVKDYEVRG